MENFPLMHTVRSEEMKTKQRNILVLAVVAICLMLALWFYTSRDTARIRSHFGISLPQDATVVAHRIDTFGFDGSVAWVLELSNRSGAIELIPEGFAEFPITDDPSSKYQEVLAHFRGELPEAFLDFGKTRVFVGGPSGNSLMGIADTQDRIILLRFWT